MNEQIEELLERVAATEASEWTAVGKTGEPAGSCVVITEEDRDALVAAVRELQEQLTIERQATHALRRKIGDMEGWPE